MLEILADVELGIILAILIVVAIALIRKKKKKAYFLNDTAADEKINDISDKISLLNIKINEIHEIQTNKDQEGIPLIYFRKSLEDAIKELGAIIIELNMYQSRILTEIIKYNDSQNNKKTD